MRLTLAIPLTLTSLAAQVQGVRHVQEVEAIPELNVDSRRLNTEFTCFGDHDFDLYFKGKCTYDELVTRMDVLIQENAKSCLNSAADEVLFLLGYSDASQEGEARETVKQLCKTAMDLAASDPGKVVDWEDISDYGPNFDQSYFDGKTFWNEEVQTDIDTIVPGLASNRLDIDAERIDDLYETVAERVPFAWPKVTNLENCEIRAAMCCWVSDRQANDDNGNCKTPYDTSCADADPSANTELCAVDYAKSDATSSSYVDDGISLFPYNDEGPVHCHGMAWSNDDMEAGARYRGNNLFYISMYDHMYNRGYVRNIPGAPMCGCVEKMPIVERADCTEIKAVEFWKFSWDAQGGFSTSLDRAEIEFDACRNNDLETHYKDLKDGGHATDEERWLLQRTLVGRNRCNEATKAMLYDKGYDEYYPNAGFDDDNGELYSIKAYGGTNSGISYLHTTGGGSLQLQATVTDAKSKWRIVPARGSDNMYNIRPVPGASGLTFDKQYLGADHWGRTSMASTDSTRGLERWYFRPVPGIENTYNIIITGGTRIGETYLSTNSDGSTIHLHHEDDVSGRQRWVIEKLEESFDLASLVVRKNFAIGMPTSQSSVGWGGSSARAVDGNISGIWRYKSVTHTMKDVNPWWKVNLPQSYNIEEIVVYLRTDCCMDRSAGFLVEVFNDGAMAFNYTQTGAMSSSTLITVIGDADEVIVGNEVRVSLPRQGYLSLAEVQVYAEGEI